MNLSEHNGFSFQQIEPFEAAVLDVASWWA